MKDHVGRGQGDHVFRNPNIQGDSLGESQGPADRQLDGIHVKFAELTVFIKGGMPVGLELKGNPSGRTPPTPQASKSHPIPVLLFQDIPIGHTHDPRRAVKGEMADGYSIVISGGRP